MRHVEGPILPAIIFLCLLTPVPAQAQVPRIDAVPAWLPAEIRDDLNGPRAELPNKRTVIKSKVVRHNQKCKNVPANSPRVSECRQAMSGLQSAISSYAAAVTAFNRAVARGRQNAESEFVRKEQEELDKAYEVWQERRQRSVRKAAIQNQKWADAVLQAVEGGRAPDPAHRPKSAKDLRPGDIILVAPTVGNEGKTSRWIRAADGFISGVKSPASHTLAVIGRDARGHLLFLDHQLGQGTRIRGETEFRQYYGDRKMHVAAVAKVLTPVSGRRLLRASLDAHEREIAHKGSGTTYGVYGKDLVCSEVIAVAVGKATGVDYRRIAPRTRLKAIASIDITPAEFFDKRHVGKYFVISPLTLWEPK